MDWKDTNPKSTAATDRMPMSLFPDTALTYGNLAFLEGALKYGRYNWRVKGVRASTYVDAMRRHLMKWWGGQFADPNTGVPHLASVLACAAILIDSHEYNKLLDDRPPIDPDREVESDLLGELQITVRHLHRHLANFNPHQYTIEDAISESSPSSLDVVDRSAENSSGDREHSQAEAQ